MLEGRFIDYSHGFQDTPHSTDNTVDIVEKYADKFIMACDLPQHTMRDMYLQGDEGDFYFIVDADEVLTNFSNIHKYQIIHGTTNVYGVRLYKNNMQEQLCLRIFRHKPGIKHNVGQCPLIDDKGKLMDGSNYEVVIFNSFWLEHLKQM